MNDYCFWLGIEGDPTMRFWRCQCGDSYMWESGMAPVHNCQGCEKCQTTYANGPSGHRPLEPHDWQPRFDSHTGQPDGTECGRCHKRDFDMLHDNQTPATPIPINPRRKLTL